MAGAEAHMHAHVNAYIDTCTYPHMHTLTYTPVIGKQYRYPITKVKGIIRFH